MKKVMPIILLLFSLCRVHSQGQATVSGQVFNKGNNAPIAFASVVVVDAENNLVSGNITSGDGRFVIQGLAKAEYKLVISFVGYEKYETQILVGELNNVYDLGRIYLAVSSTELESATITGEKGEVSAAMDKKVYNMDNNIAQAGGSVLDAMKTMPGVTVDQDGKIILRGSDKVIVLIDGKQSSLTGFGNQKGLDNIPAANIEQIEIINNPSAKYDAAGMAGIVNIIYKKEKQYGLHGNVGISYGLGAMTKPKADLPTELGSFSPTPKYIPSLDLNYNKEKINLFLQSEVLIQEKLPNNEFTTRHYDDGRSTISQVPENRKQTHYIIKGGSDFIFDDKNLLTVSGIFDWEHHIDSAQVPYIDMGTNNWYRFIGWNEEEMTGYMNYAVQYEHKFYQPGHKFNASLQYSKGWEDETYYINDSSGVRQGRDITNILGVEHTTALNVDYTKPLRSGRLEGGTKLQVRSLPVDYTVDRGVNSIVYPGMGEWSKWGESVYAAYLNLVHEKTKYDVEAGLRTEYTKVYYNMDESNIYFKQNDSYDYLEFFPNIRLSYKINPGNKFSVFYNRRVDRPGEPELRMFAKSDDHELLKVGNPYLRPQFTQSAELAYKTSWSSGSVFLSGYFRFVDSPYMRIYSIDETNVNYDVIIKSYANTGSAENKGAELVFSQKIHEFWKVNGNVNFYQNTIRDYTGTLLFPYEHTFTIDEAVDNTWDFKVSNLVSLKNNVEFQLTGIYYAPKNILQGKQLARSSIDFGLKMPILDGKWDLNISFSDVFNNYGIRQEIQSDGFNAVYENYYETQVVRVGVKYKF